MVRIICLQSMLLHSKMMIWVTGLEKEAKVKGKINCWGRIQSNLSRFHSWSKWMVSLNTWSIGLEVTKTKPMLEDWKRTSSKWVLSQGKPVEYVWMTWRMKGIHSLLHANVLAQWSSSIWNVYVNGLIQRECPRSWKVFIRIIGKNLFVNFVKNLSLWVSPLHSPLIHL